MSGKRRRGARLAAELRRRLEELAAQRRAPRLKRAELADALGVSRVTLNQYWEVVERLAEDLGISSMLPSKDIQIRALRQRAARQRARLSDIHKELDELRRHHIALYTFLIRQGVEPTALLQHLATTDGDLCPLCGGDSAEKQQLNHARRQLGKPASGRELRVKIARRSSRRPYG